MSRSRNESNKLAALAGATVIAVGFAGWTVSKALAPTASEPELRVSSATAGREADATADEREGTENLEAQSEASLAPGVDPFAPLTVVAIAADPESESDVAARSGQAASGEPSLLAAGASRLFQLPEATVSSADGRDLRLWQAALPPAKEPAEGDAFDLVLAGTLLGEHPSAVFQKGDALVVIAVGETIGKWQVVSVRHGSVTVRTSKRTLDISVGGLEFGGHARMEVESLQRQMAMSGTSGEELRTAPAAGAAPDIEIDVSPVALEPEPSATVDR